MADTTLSHPSDSDVRHSLTTRLVHAGLAIAIIVQLASSQFMDPDGGGDTVFAVHQYSGLIAFGLVLAFWIHSMTRQRGTSAALLFPWFSASRLGDVWRDLRAHLAALGKFHVPRHDDHSPFASAIHGLGLLLVTAMAASGSLYYFVNTGDPDAGGLVGLAMVIHVTLSNLVWAYLIGHAAMALIAHYASALSLRQMWSLRGQSPRS